MLKTAQNPYYFRIKLELSKSIEVDLKLFSEFHKLPASRMIRGCVSL